MLIVFKGDSIRVNGAKWSLFHTVITVVSTAAVSVCVCTVFVTV